ncbi:uncharacterized protein [Littorina saxatilis]|uniref:CUB domain-containing protein n=1 Tax=Littorina saxatilis TaxID=31220 RepID=A0AAN9B951_9CAEN
MAMVPVTVLLLLSMVAPVGWCQSNNQPIQPGTYYLDSNADCNGPVREIYAQKVRVIGHGTIQEQQSPQSCTLQLRSTSALEQTQLRIEVVAATIRDCDVRVSISDGDPDQNILRGFDCNSPTKPNERDYVTTGDLVSITLTRRDSINTLFDIEFFVTPLVSGNKPGYENDYGDSYGFFKEKLENDAAIGIVGAVFAVTVILVIIGIFCCRRRYEGKNKPWEQHQLASFQPEHSVYETKSKMSDTSSGVWASNMSRSQAQSAPRHRVEPTRHMARPSEDEDSVFDATDEPPKKQLMDRDRRWQRERERERDKQRGRGREYASQNNSFVQADDDHPQDTFVERVITPRVRPSRSHKPPPYEEALEESETERSELEEEEDSDDVDHKETSEEESEEPSSEEEEEEEKAGAAAPRPAPRPKPQPGYPPNAFPLQPGMPPPGAYPGYPPMGYPVPQGQFVPIMAPPPGQQYAQMGPGYPPPRYQGQPQPQPQPPQSNIRPTDPPIYSYLVQRGYTPLDMGRDSPVSLANTSQSQASADDSDKNILSPGVEYMRR